MTSLIYLDLISMQLTTMLIQMKWFLFQVYKLNIVKSSSNITDTMTSTNDSSYKIEWSKELIISLVSIIVILGIIITAIVIHIKRKKNSEI